MARRRSPQTVIFVAGTDVSARVAPSSRAVRTTAAGARNATQRGPRHLRELLRGEHGEAAEAEDADADRVRACDSRSSGKLGQDVVQLSSLAGCVISSSSSRSIPENGFILRRRQRR
jgi:hypothetical protein